MSDTHTDRCRPDCAIDHEAKAQRLAETEEMHRRIAERSAKLIDSDEFWADAAEHVKRVRREDATVRRRRRAARRDPFMGGAR